MLGEGYTFVCWDEIYIIYDLGLTSEGGELDQV